MKRFLVLVFVCVALVSCVAQENEDVIKIGASLDLTGTRSEYGSWARNALELGKDEINASGGLHGKALEIVYEDCKFLPQPAVTAFKKLVSVDRVPVAVHFCGATGALAVAPVANETRTVHMDIAVVAPKFTSKGDYTFRVASVISEEVDAGITFAEDSLYVKRVAILWTKNDYGEAIAKRWRSVFSGEIVYDTYFPQAKVDFRTELAKIDSLGVDLVVVASFNESPYLAKQMVELGMDAPLLATMPFENQQTLRIAGTAAEGVYYTYPNLRIFPEISDAFQSSYKMRFGEEAGVYAARSYDALLILSEVMRDCDVITSDCIRDGLFGKSYSGVSGQKVFDESGDVHESFAIKAVKNGKFTWMSE